MRTRWPLVRCLALALILCAAANAFARQGTPPRSKQMRTLPLPTVKQLVVKRTDVTAELADDERRGNPIPLRFATTSDVNITPLTHGTWEAVPGGRLWRLRVLSAGATDLNFGFAVCELPKGATLHLFSEDEDYFQGPFTARDNKAHGQLWTPLLPGSRAVIELFVPEDAVEEPRLVLSSVNAGYRDMFRRKNGGAQPKAGACNNDVICPLGDSWRSEIRSVARYTVNGNSLCTGTLINNVSNNFRNFFLTAHHCGVTAANAATVVVYWNFESPACGQHGGGSLAQNQSGAIFRMSRSDVDMTLIELDDIPDSSFRVYYSGWDRSGAAPAGAVGIHHPRGHEKSISFANSTLTTMNNCIASGANTHWRVFWNSGVTEPGSSGSGIWDPNTRRLVGTLSGGDSSCSAPNAYDCYGKFSVAWNNGATSAQRLRDWLDPAGTGPTSLPGIDPFAKPWLVAGNSAIISESFLPTNHVIEPGETVTVSFALRNTGGSNTVNLIATLLNTNGVTKSGAPQNYGVVPTTGSAVSRTFSFVASGACGSVITPTLSLHDGTNDYGRVSFSFRMGVPAISFSENFDLVAAPHLPDGWSTMGVGAPRWGSVTSQFHTSPNSLFAPELNELSEAILLSPSIPISTTNASLSFRHSYDMEDGFDGGVLEISLNNGPFFDIIAAGGTFVSGAYNDWISHDYGSPIAGRDSWTGNSGGFASTVVNLPITAAGQNIRLRWRLATDESVGGNGWYVDSVSLNDGYACLSDLTPPLIVDLRRINDAVSFSFQTVPGRAYVTEFRDSLETNLQWSPLQTNAGDGTLKTITNASPAATNRYFRVRAE